MGEPRTIFDTICAHAFFAGLPAEDLELIAGCGRNQLFQPDQYLAREGEAADTFFVVRRGSIAVELQVPGQGGRILQTLHGGDIAGWSWIFPPYRWSIDLRAVEPVAVVEFDGRCLRGKCEQTPALGYRLMKRFAEIMSERVQVTRFQLLDLYGHRERAAAPIHASDSRERVNASDSREPDHASGSREPVHGSGSTASREGRDSRAQKPEPGADG